MCGVSSSAYYTYMGLVLCADSPDCVLLYVLQSVIARFDKGMNEGASRTSAGQPSRRP